MKKILFALCLLLPLMASAAPVSREKALDEAAAFLAQKNPASARHKISSGLTGRSPLFCR